jgi:hypothetical protein
MSTTDNVIPYARDNIICQPCPIDHNHTMEDSPTDWQVSFPADMLESLEAGIVPDGSGVFDDDCFVKSSVMEKRIEMDEIDTASSKITSLEMVVVETKRQCSGVPDTVVETSDEIRQQYATLKAASDAIGVTVDNIQNDDAIPIATSSTHTIYITPDNGLYAECMGTMVSLRLSVEWGVEANALPLFYLSDEEFSIVTNLGYYGSWNLTTGEMCQSYTFKTGEAHVVPSAMCMTTLKYVIVAHQPNDTTVFHVLSPNGVYYSFTSGALNVTSMACNQDGVVYACSNLGYLTLFEALPLEFWAFVPDVVWYSSMPQIAEPPRPMTIGERIHPTTFEEEKIICSSYSRSSSMYQNGIDQPVAFAKNTKAVRAISLPGLPDTFRFITCYKNECVVMVSDTQIVHITITGRGRTITSRIVFPDVIMVKLVTPDDIIIYMATLQVSRAIKMPGETDMAIASTAANLFTEGSTVEERTFSPSDSLISINGTTAKVLDLQGNIYHISFTLYDPQ